MAVGPEGEWPLLKVRCPIKAATLEHLDGTLAERFNTDKFSIKPTLIRDETARKPRPLAYLGQKRYSAVSEAVSVDRLMPSFLAW